MSSLLEHLDVHLKPDSKTSSWHRRFAQNVHKQLTSSPEDQTPTPQNGTCLQAFEWYTTNDGTHLKRLTKDLPLLKEMGITAMWLPPLCKGDAGVNDVGYGVYDLWDLGQFPTPRKGSGNTIRNKYGDIHDVEELATQATTNDINLYFDAVLNHKAGADDTDECVARKVDINNRLRDISGDMKIKGWFKFDFPGRLPDNPPEMSKMVWGWQHFTGCDWDDISREQGQIYRVMGDGKSFATDVDNENGNYDYLMYADIDHHHPEVIQDLFSWGTWIHDKLDLHGFRLDAIKHYSEGFLQNLLTHLTSNSKKDLFFVGEYWKDNLGTQEYYLSNMHHQLSLFDTELVYKFKDASWQPDYDLRKIFDGTLLQSKPINACTLVSNHDTQKGQALEVDINGWFKPLAYALILLRISGYPCVFWGDLVGTAGPSQGEGPSCGGQLPDLILVRSLYAYGVQEDYFDYATCIGFVRRGTWDREGCAVVMSDAGDGYKDMFVGVEHKGETWTDVLGWNKAKVVIDENGSARFHCSATSVSVYVRDGAPGRELFGKVRPEAL